jgi:hypothetical protein
MKIPLEETSDLGDKDVACPTIATRQHVTSQKGYMAKQSPNF